MSHDRLEELRADRAVWGLDEAEREELERLEQQLGVASDWSWDQVAATYVAAHSRSGTAPHELLRKLQAGALDYHVRAGVVRFDDVIAATGDGDGDGGPGMPPEGRPLRRLPDDAGVAPADEGASGAADAGSTARLAWAVAALLAVSCALLGWRAFGPTPSVRSQREAMLQAGDQILRVDWDAGVGSLEGDVVWNPVTQSGFLLFRGLPQNDPAQERYQLWIFDKHEDPKAPPVDGGLFDVELAADGTAVVAIDARVMVREAAAFAVTVEDPGGVVVSKQERIVAKAVSP